MRQNTVNINRAKLITLVEKEIDSLIDQVKAAKTSFDRNYPAYLRNVIRYKITRNNWEVMKTKHTNVLLKAALNENSASMLEKRNIILATECTCSVCKQESQEPVRPPELFRSSSYFGNPVFNDGSDDLITLSKLREELAVLKMSDDKTVKLLRGHYNSSNNLLLNLITKGN